MPPTNGTAKGGLIEVEDRAAGEDLREEGLREHLPQHFVLLAIIIRLLTPDHSLLKSEYDLNYLQEVVSHCFNA